MREEKVAYSTDHTFFFSNATCSKFEGDPGRFLFQLFYEFIHTPVFNSYSKLGYKSIKNLKKNNMKIKKKNYDCGDSIIRITIPST